MDCGIDQIPERLADSGKLVTGPGGARDVVKTDDRKFIGDFNIEFQRTRSNAPMAIRSFEQKIAVRMRGHPAGADVEQQHNPIRNRNLLRFRGAKP